MKNMYGWCVAGGLAEKLAQGGVFELMGGQAVLNMAADLVIKAGMLCYSTIKHVHACTYTRTYIHTRASTTTCTHNLMHACSYTVHAHTVRKPTCMHACAHAHMHLHENRHCCAVLWSGPNDLYWSLPFPCRSQCKVVPIQSQPHQRQGAAGFIIPCMVIQTQSSTSKLLCCCRLARSKLARQDEQLMELLCILAG